MPGPHQKIVTQEESATLSEGEGEAGLPAWRVQTRGCRRWLLPMVASLDGKEHANSLSICMGYTNGGFCLRRRNTHLLASLGSKGTNRNSLACLRNAGFDFAITYCSSACL